MEARELRRIARENLSGNWGNAVLTGLLAALLGGLIASGTNSINLNLDEHELFSHTFQTIRGFLRVAATAATGVNLVHFILGGVIRQGYAVYLLKQYDQRDPQTNDLFSQFDYFGNAFCLHFLQGLFVFLWSLLLIIPGIVKSYAYAMVPFIMAENPEMPPRDVLRASEELMDGHKLELAFLELSFIGWALLSALTMGIGGLWLTPYIQAAHAAFYRNLSHVTVE